MSLINYFVILEAVSNVDEELGEMFLDEKVPTLAQLKVKPNFSLA